MLNFSFFSLLLRIKLFRYVTLQLNLHIVEFQDKVRRELKEI